MPRSPDQNGYSQPPLDGFEEEKKEEIVLEHVVVDSLPTWKMNGGVYEWSVTVHCPPDIFNQDRNELYEVKAKSYAHEAKKKRLRPGDIVTVKGHVTRQEILLEGGGTQTLNQLALTEIDVVKRAKRTSITVYERKRGK